MSPSIHTELEYGCNHMLKVDKMSCPMSIVPGNWEGPGTTTNGWVKEDSPIDILIGATPMGDRAPVTPRTTMLDGYTRGLRPRDLRVGSVTMLMELPVSRKREHGTSLRVISSRGAPNAGSGSWREWKHASAASLQRSIVGDDLS